MVKYRKHSWRELTTSYIPALWRPGHKAFKCHRCGIVAWASESFMQKLNRPRWRYYKNPRIQIPQERRRKLNSHLENWVIKHISPYSIDCDMVPVAEIMEN